MTVHKEEVAYGWQQGVQVHCGDTHDAVTDMMNPEFSFAIDMDVDNTRSLLGECRCKTATICLAWQLPSRVESIVYLICIGYAIRWLMKISSSLLRALPAVLDDR